MKLVITSTSLLAMSSAAAAFSSITRRQFRKGITTHAARNIASIFTVTAYLKPSSVFAGVGKTSSVVRRTTSSLGMTENKERPFATWTFDNACDTMEFNRIAKASLAASADISIVDNSDLIVLGIYGPAKESSENEADEGEGEGEGDDDAKEVPVPVLSGRVKELDEELGGAISEVLVENYKSFKHGGKACSATPTLRVPVSGSKVNTILNRCLELIDKPSSHEINF